MEEEYLAEFTPRSPSTVIKITYVCCSCRDITVLFQPYPREPHNTDFRGWCPNCKQITHKERILPTQHGTHNGTP